MGSQPPIRGARPPSHVAYYVALAGVVVLLILLCCYFLFFCIKRVKELTVQEYCNTTQLTASPKPATSIHQGVRDSASAMAKLCRQLPSQPGTVFPEEQPAPNAPQTASPGKVVAPNVTVATVNEINVP